MKELNGGEYAMEGSLDYVVQKAMEAAKAPGFRRLNLIVEVRYTGPDGQEVVLNMPVRMLREATHAQIVRWCARRGAS